ncbi:MAG: hypothetical protein FJY67_12240, partial [Calditrichaeota bacterium]|nr:hypothetical protein [Calditrichota bacterium]
MNEENWQATANVRNFQVFPGQDQPYSCVAHDGHNLWVGGYAAQNFRIYDDGVTEAYWLIVEPEEGALEPGASMDVIFTLDATGLIEGDYEADVHFMSNDPVDDDVAVNVTLFVHGAPDITVAWPANIGFPDVVNWNRAYPDLFTGFAYDIVVNVTNDGTADLTVDGFDCDNGMFTASPDQFVIGPDETQRVTLTLGAEDDGDHAGTFTIWSDDPDESEYQFAVFGATGAPPIFGIDPGAIEDELFTGGSADHEITVTNDGGAPLRFAIETEIIAEPGRDDNGRDIRSLAGPVARRDNPGQLLGQFVPNGWAANQYKSPAGWDWDNERMWITSYTNAAARAYTHDNNYQNFQQVIQINPGNCMDGAWINGLYWTSTLGNAQIQRFNAQGQGIGAINAPAGVYGLAADIEENRLFIQTSEANQPIHVYPLNQDNTLGQRIGTISNHIQYHNNIVAYGIDWVPKHPDGKLWMTSYNNMQVNQIAVNEANWQCTGRVQGFQVFPGADQPYSCVAHDGHNLWVGGYAAQNFRIYDDGV